MYITMSQFLKIKIDLWDFFNSYIKFVDKEKR